VSSSTSCATRSSNQSYESRSVSSLRRLPRGPVPHRTQVAGPTLGAFRHRAPRPQLLRHSGIDFRQVSEMMPPGGPVIRHVGCAPGAEQGCRLVTRLLAPSTLGRGQRLEEPDNRLGAFALLQQTHYFVEKRCSRPLRNGRREYFQFVSIAGHSESFAYWPACTSCISPKHPWTIPKNKRHRPLGYRHCGRKSTCRRPEGKPPSARAAAPPG
jgi:hypothetical protein